MQIIVIYGNPKRSGFVHGSLDHVAARLTERGVEVERLHLVDADLRECVGCFQCLRTGTCSVHDDMSRIIESLRKADALVIGASVRNGYFPALYKRFVERITYPLGFTRDLRGKPVLGIGSVGFAGGRGPLGHLVTLKDFQTRVVDYLFFATGIPTRKKVDDVAPRLDEATDRLLAAAAGGTSLGWLSRVQNAADDWVMRTFMFKPNRDHVYDHVISRWREKGLM